jgi:excisionase family DNA binding protein
MKLNKYEVTADMIAEVAREQIRKNLLIGIDEACRLMDCSRSTLQREVVKGLLPYYKRSEGRSKVFFRLADVEAYIDKIKCTGEL